MTSIFGTAPVPPWHPSAQRQPENTTLTCGECGKVRVLTPYDVFSGAGETHFAACSQWVPIYTAGMVHNQETCSHGECIKVATVELSFHGAGGDNGLKEYDVKLGFCGEHGGQPEPVYQPEGYNPIFNPTRSRTSGGRAAMTIERTL